MGVLADILSGFDVLSGGRGACGIGGWEKLSKYWSGKVKDNRKN